MNVSDFIGKVLVGIDISDDEVRFVDSDGNKYLFYHSQDCCESVGIDNICGQVEDLIGHTIIESEEEIYSGETPEGEEDRDYDDSFTWTIHRFKTSKGYLEIKWLGQSNGYYGEGVDLVQVK